MSISPSLVKNLEIISQLQIYDKLNTNNEIIYIDNGYMQFLIRYYYGCNRTNTIDRLTKICESLENYISSIGINIINNIINPPCFYGNNKNLRAKKQKYKNEKKQISNEVLQSIKLLMYLLPKVSIGISNLIETYKNDMITQQELSNIKIRLNKIILLK